MVKFWETLARPICHPPGFFGGPEGERENLGGTPPDHCLTLPLSSAQRHSQTQTVKIHVKNRALTKISAAT